MKIEWDKLGFRFMPAKSNLRYVWRNGAWSKGELTEDYTVEMSIAATCLHYGQAIFEGLKAFSCKDGKIRIFRPLENLKRLNKGLEYILAPEIPEEMFIEGIKRIVSDNKEYVPPYGTGGSLYIRPFVIGTGAQIGVAPADEYMFIIMVVPVGAYYKKGLVPVDALIMDEFDRAAPQGTGNIKLGGNYAASLMPSKIAKSRGYPITLFLDPKEKKYIDEFGTSNFIAITEDKKYVTPDSPSILASITNKSLCELASESGIRVERRRIHIDELASFSEVGACGTAVVITPIRKIVYKDKEFFYGEHCGKTLSDLYYKIISIQYGEIPDTHGWMLDVT